MSERAVFEIATFGASGCQPPLEGAAEMGLPAPLRVSETVRQDTAFAETEPTLEVEVEEIGQDAGPESRVLSLRDDELVVRDAPSAAPASGAASAPVVPPPLPPPSIRERANIAQVVLSPAGEVLHSRGLDPDEFSARVAYAARLAELIGRAIQSGTPRALALRGKRTQTDLEWRADGSVAAALELVVSPKMR